MTLADIAEESGLPARTIRFYIARGLLSGPVKGGRGAEYSPEHLEQLERIKKLQAEGRTLSEIGHLVGKEADAPAAVADPTSWWQHTITDDVTVWIKAGASPWRTKQVRAALDEFARRVQASGDTKNQEDR